jgi:hypothetical protein
VPNRFHKKLVVETFRTEAMERRSIFALKLEKAQP